MAAEAITWNHIDQLSRMAVALQQMAVNLEGCAPDAFEGMLSHKNQDLNGNGR